MGLQSRAPLNGERVCTLRYLAGSEVRSLGSAALALVRTAFLEECATRPHCAAQLAATLGAEPPQRT